MRLRGVACGLMAPVALAAQQPARERSCNLELYNYDSTTTLAVKLPSGQYNSYYGRGVRGKCTNTDQRLSGDSLESMGDVKTHTLIGRAHYDEQRVRLDADRITYVQAEERVLAEGNVVAVTEKGTTMRGPRAEYFRAMPGIRAESRLYATGRPVTKLSPQDAGGGDSDTVEVIANQVLNVADSLVSTSDSATMDSGREWARLNGRPRIEGRGESKFTLVGRQVDLWSRHRRLERVLSADSAQATSDDVTLASDTIDLRLTDQKLSRAFAWGKSRARAHATDRDILADSIDVDMPGQVLRELRALRGAYAKSRTDSTKFLATEDDWLRGDTIVAAFDSARAAGDSTTKPVIRSILASGDASSFYQVASSEGAKAAPNLNYVKGKAITVQFGADRAVSTVTVREKASGVYLERIPTDTARSDSTRAGAAAKANASAKPAPPPGRTPARPATPKGAAASPSTPVKKP
ncbi:MAG: hypothetical protein ACYC7F_10000 [Gemmatimonadaceae bacterium]